MTHLFYMHCTNIWRIIMVLLLSITWGVTYTHASPELKNIQIGIGKKQNATALILEFSDIFDFQIQTLNKTTSQHSDGKASYRLIIDMPHFKSKVTPHLNVEGLDFITLVRYGSYTPQISRIVVETKRPISVDNLQLVISSTNKSSTSKKLFVYISPIATFEKIIKQTSDWNTVAQNNAVAEQKRQQTRQQLYNKIKSDKNRKKPLIVLDAGHGGYDPGAIGLNGVYEKNVTLEIAKNVKQVLDKTGKFDVLLSRTDDRYISLKERSEIPDRIDANFFISIHADKHHDPQVRGMSVYTLNHDREQREINKVLTQPSAQDKIKDTIQHDGNRDISGILGELGLEDSNQSANAFAKILVTRMDINKIVTLHNPKREASLGVLVALHTPSVLVEAAYMSNKYDMINLQSSKWKKRFSKALSEAIITYFSKYPLIQ